MNDIIQQVYTTITQRVQSVQRQSQNTSMHSERSEFTGSALVCTFWELPTAATGATAGCMAWVTDGRKSGETAGNGTGVLAVFDEADGVWVDVGNGYTPVAI